jgi:hypothetical protein
MASDSQPHFYEGGQTFIIQWLTGSAAPPTAEDVANFEQITRSISFPAWKDGETMGGWTSVGQVLPSASAQWITFEGDHYVASYGPPRALLGMAPACSSGGPTYEIRQTGVAAITCANGDTAEWDFTNGKASAGNAGFGSSDLTSYPAVLSSDGQLLVELSPPSSLSPTPAGG